MQKTISSLISKQETEVLGRSNVFFTLLLQVFSPPLLQYPCLRSTISLCLYALAFCWDKINIYTVHGLNFYFLHFIKHTLWNEKECFFCCFDTKNRCDFSPKYVAGIWPGVKDVLALPEDGAAVGPGTGHKLPKPRTLYRSDCLGPENSSEENKQHVYWNHSSLVSQCTSWEHLQNSLSL